MYRIKLENPPAGYSASAAKSGEKVEIITREFSSSEDGDFFISRLEGFPSQLISKLPPESGVKCSNIDHLLAVIHKSGECDVYANELELTAMVKPTRDVKKNDPVYEDDLADIISLEFEGVKIPEDCGVMVIFSKGWRKGLYFDFSPVNHNGKGREYSLPHALGHYYSYLFFQDLYKISHDEWTKLFVQQWFPFIGLKKDTVNSLVNYMRADWNCDDLMDTIRSEVKQTLKSNVVKWRESKIFGEHIEFISCAAERFLDGDNISSISILYPRIEGILRDFNVGIDVSHHSQSNLSKAPLKMSMMPENKYTRLLPDKFTQYLKDVYFANFSPDAPAEVSRNSVGHGVAKLDSFSDKSSVLGFLIIDQLFYHKPASPRSVKSE
ncbi:hypothetical protein ACP6IB_27150 [Vibrio harveyi]|uniref:hypothetical protein n=1 Tax=Vibrio harveyi TaxID=669 RepID=UPI00028CB77D|nr:hypothetical protein [Vibrio harveyi]EKM16624.1 hypothetical protein VCHENC01_2971 [Vibrio harveyi]